MKKLFFIPAVFFVLLIAILVNSDSATSEEAPQGNVTIDIFILDDKGQNFITEPMTGCVGPLNFSTSTGYIQNAGTLPEGIYNACTSGSGYLGTISSQGVYGSSVPVIFYVSSSSGACSMCNED